VTYLYGKITNLEYYNFAKKVFTKQSYHIWRFSAFKPNYQCYGHNHDIVYLNDPILCKSVRLRTTSNVVEGSFHCLCTKNSIFIFWVPQIDVFVKELPTLNFKIGSKQSPKKVYNIGFTIQHLFEQNPICRYFLFFQQLSADSVGRGSNLNYKCFIVCS
jgi:hypothetical protein